MSILDILNQVAATNSPIEKAAILRENIDNSTLKEVCRLANHPLLCWYTTHTTSPPKIPTEWSLEYVIPMMLNVLPTRKATGNAAKAFMDDILSHLSVDDEEVIRRVILKDLRSGFGESITNKVWPGLVQTFDFLLCDTDPSSIVYPAYSQLKADGMRCAMSIDERGNYTLMSRNGKPIDDLNKMAADAMHISDLMDNQPTILDGELVCYEVGAGFLDRKTSNGILNKAIRGTISEKEAELIHYVGWDIVDTTSTLPYRERWEMFCDLTYQCSKISYIETFICKNEKEALKHFKRVRREGKEGTIIKNTESKWVPKRSKELCKFKAEIEAEFRVTGFEYGTGKNATRVGKLNIQSECGLIKCNVGIFKDFEDSVRDEWLTDTPKIVTILYNERITDKSRKDGTESLFLPRVTAVRLDKDVANTREEMIEIERRILLDD